MRRIKSVFALLCGKPVASNLTVLGEFRLGEPALVSGCRFYLKK
jgi:hypothetical protein